jgi:hypothetical protein
VKFNWHRGKGVVREWFVQTKTSQHRESTTSGTVERTMAHSKEGAGGSSTESGKQGEASVRAKGGRLTSAGKAKERASLHDETRVEELMAVQEEAEKTIEEEE